MNAAELEKNIKQQGYLIKGIIPRRGIGVLYGLPSTMKTFWTIDMALHVAMGREYQGRRVEAGTVLYCPFEGVWGIPNRLKAFHMGHALPVPDNFMVLTDDLSFSKRPSEGHGWLIDSVKATGISPKLVILDTLAQSIVGSENKDEDMGFYLRAARDIAKTLDCAVLIIHHTGKDGSVYRGHSSLEGNADFILTAARSGERASPSDMVSITVKKMKDGIEGLTVHSWVRIIEIGIDEDGDRVTSCYLEPAPAPKEHISFSKMSKQTSKAYAILEELWEEYGEDEVTLDMWKTAIKDHKVAKGTDTAQGKVYLRALMQLREKGVIQIVNNRFVAPAEAG